VQKFVRTDLPACHDGESRSIFIEPRIGSSRPDVVAVYWCPAVTEEWPRARLSLSKSDLRLAHLLFLEGRYPEDKLQVAFPRRLHPSLSRLEDAGIIRCNDGFWETRDFHKIFAVRRIITVEAKLSAMTRALEQAYINTWFASESYVLTPVKEPRSSTLSTAVARGVGILLLSEEMELFPLLDAKRQCVPQSYGSWLLNELVWRTELEALYD
jgi:hypothetical protein